jgi:hypothetical protein
MAPSNSSVSSHMLLLTNSTNFFELELLREESDSGSVNGYPTVLFRAAASANGFRGESEAWVFTEHLEKFCKSLVSLNDLLRGEASLDSLSPNELSVKLASVNSRGYLGVSGQIGKHFFTENSDYWHSVSFGFEFEPAQLQAAIRVPWITRFVG